VIHLKDGSKTMTFEKACSLMPGDEIAELGKRTGNYAAYEGQTGGVHFAEVEVDVEDGTISVTRYLAMQDAGTIINPLTAESQVNGAIVQGVSYALFEERVIDRQLGQQVNADMEMYKIAGPKDMPHAEVVSDGRRQRRQQRRRRGTRRRTFRARRRRDRGSGPQRSRLPGVVASMTPIAPSRPSPRRRTNEGLHVRAAEGRGRSGRAAAGANCVLKGAGTDPRPSHEGRGERVPTSS
jgi:hypothetical protein